MKKQSLLLSRKKYWFAIIILIMTACSSNPSDNKNIEISETLQDTTWLNQFDIDGDGIKDHIYFDFSGGTHCCYKINIVLSSDKKERKFPFEMDGGYVWGVDNSQPEQFNIQDIDGDGLPEILMKIQTYNNVSNSMPAKWLTEYGIKSNYIVIEYSNKQLKIRDLNKELTGITVENKVLFATYYAFGKEYKSVVFVLTVTNLSDTLLIPVLSNDNIYKHAKFLVNNKEVTNPTAMGGLEEMREKEVLLKDEGDYFSWGTSIDYLKKEYGNIFTVQWKYLKTYSGVLEVNLEDKTAVAMDR